MRQIYSIVFAVFLCFLISCDGRDRSFKSNLDVLKENKLLDSFSENISYHPAKALSIVTDTILSNGFSIKIKNWTNKNENISSSYVKDSIKHITNYRQFTSNIEVKKGDDSIFYTTLNKDIILSKYKALIKENLNVSNIRFGGAFVNQQILNSESIQLLLYLDNPIIKTLYIYKFIISNNGNEEFEFSKKLKYGE